MSTEQLPSRWIQMRDRIKARWPQLRDEQLDQVHARWDHLAALVEEQYGLDRESARQEVEAFRRTQDPIEDRKVPR